VCVLLLYKRKKHFLKKSFLEKKKRWRLDLQVARYSQTCPSQLGQHISFLFLRRLFFFLFHPRQILFFKKLIFIYFIFSAAFFKYSFDFLENVSYINLIQKFILFHFLYINLRKKFSWREKTKNLKNKRKSFLNFSFFFLDRPSRFS
jgi:hypothetical protein